jgi:hypothetical protein
MIKPELTREETIELQALLKAVELTLSDKISAEVGQAILRKFAGDNKLDAILHKLQQLAAVEPVSRVGLPREQWEVNRKLLEGAIDGRS